MQIRNLLIKTLSTFFYVGYLPFIPGTFASIVGALLFYLVKESIFAHTLLILVLLILGFWVSGKAERIWNRKDASCIVIDEVSGMLLAFMFIPYDIRIVLIAFILFRILDALKPYPADKFQGFSGSIGIMGDDIVAGLYTNIILQLVLRYASFKTS